MQFEAKQVEAFEKETWSRSAGSYVAGFGALMGEAITPLMDKVIITRYQKRISGPLVDRGWLRSHSRRSAARALRKALDRPPFFDPPTRA